jgi:hypothetical protein
MGPSPNPPEEKARVTLGLSSVSLQCVSAPSPRKPHHPKVARLGVETGGWPAYWPDLARCMGPTSLPILFPVAPLVLPGPGLAPGLACTARLLHRLFSGLHFAHRIGLLSVGSVPTGLHLTYRQQSPGWPPLISALGHSMMGLHRRSDPPYGV